jgi:hypothetical protein
MVQFLSLEAWTDLFSMSKHKKKRARSLASFKRRQGNLQPRKCVLIVCEGEQTEPNYFKSLRDRLRLKSVEVEIRGSECGSAPISVVDHAIAVRRKRKSDVQSGHTNGLEFDEVWCVFDQENPRQGHPSFHQAVNKAGDNNFELAVSTPAFEYWYLLHFVETDRPFHSANEVITVLREYLPDYDKSQDVFDMIASCTGTAIERAQRLWSNRPDPSDIFPNSSTLVFRLVKKLQDMTSQQY